MLPPVLCYVATAACLAVIVAVISRLNVNKIDGPRGHWLLGNLDFVCKGKLHLNFAAAVKTHGPLFFIRLVTIKVTTPRSASVC